MVNLSQINIFVCFHKLMNVFSRSEAIQYSSWCVSLTTVIEAKSESISALLRSTGFPHNEAPRLSTKQATASRVSFLKKNNFKKITTFWKTKYKKGFPRNKIFLASLRTFINPKI